MAVTVAVLNDLIFSTKIVSTGQSLGVDVRAVTSAEALEAALGEGGVKLVIVDMDAPVDVAVEALRRAAGHASKPTTIAFYSHVRTDHAAAASDAGAALIMPRSKFSAELPQLLSQYCKPG